eukprot:TRINITY_DN7919_c0_g2_i10.p1 TRINITY_DN7919_c0_g2~~TRINITY_DN7919_c0_g2_i10.p1  ORF type:complete len:338 (+),score=41.32 TRINITY_DN7919_c0_g2_i10:68-1081(+)
MQGGRTTQEMLDEYMTMAEYYEAERSRLQGLVNSLADKMKENEKRIAELELEAEKRGLIKPGTRKKEKKSELIEKLEMGPSGMTTFYYIADSKNPPLEKSDKVFIVGEVTRGRLVEMKAAQKPGHFAADLVAEPGYKYTFCFKVGNIMTIDAHYPTYLTKVGKYVNYAYVVDPRKKDQPKPTTFIDKSMHHIERKRLEELYVKVVSAGELPMLKELANHLGRLYYPLSDLEGIFSLSGVSVERKVCGNSDRSRGHCTQTNRPALHPSRRQQPRGRAQAIHRVYKRVRGDSAGGSGAAQTGDLEETPCHPLPVNSRCNLPRWLPSRCPSRRSKPSFYH